MLIQKKDFKMDVDIDKTIEYYREHSLCDCPACHNFYVQAASALPKLNAFLSELGVDVSRPDESASDASDYTVDYYFVAYTVSGKVLEYDKYEIDIQDGELFLNIVIDDNYIPNEQKGEYFVISVYGIKLPWVLDEPLPDEKNTVTLRKKKLRSYYKVTHNYKLNGHYERKHIGVYSSVEKAEEAIDTLKNKKGFSKTPSGFQIKRIFRISKPKLLDKTFWIDGFVTYTYSRQPKLKVKHFLHFSSIGLLVCNLIVFAILLSNVRWWTFALAAAFLSYMLILPFDKRKSEWSWDGLVFMTIVSIAIPICYTLIFKTYFYFVVLVIELLATVFLAVLLKRKKILY
jgi:hypothetical protein